MCTKNHNKLKTYLKFLKTVFFPGKRPYFSFQNCPGNWDRIYRIVTSIDLIAFPRTQCFCYKSPQNVDIVQQYRGSFRNFQDLQWERTSRRKIELFYVLSNQATTNICDVFSSFVLWWGCWSQSQGFILTVHQLWDFFVEFFQGLSRTLKPLCSHKQLTVFVNLRRTESADCFDVLIPQKCRRSYRECTGFSIHFDLRVYSQSGLSFSGFCSKQKCFYRV